MAFLVMDEGTLLGLLCRAYAGENPSDLVETLMEEGERVDNEEDE